MGYESLFYEKNDMLKISENNLYVDTYVHSMKIPLLKETYEVIGFNRKKKLSYFEVLKGNQLRCEASKIMDNYMIVIRANTFVKTKVIKMLGEICADYKKFSPIVFSEDNDIIFFPQLRYQDGYLIKSILESAMQHKQYQVVYGNEELIAI